MSKPDLNLLFTLNALLSEGSVAAAARRLQLSPSAMSRSLARLRQVTGDPLLVRAGRGLVPTPHALELNRHIARLVDEAEAALRPAAALDLATLDRIFTLQTRDGFVENFGPALVARVRREAPGVRLRFVPKLTRSSQTLRDGSVDLVTGVVDAEAGPELRTRLLFEDRLIAVVREGHPLADVPLTVARYAAGEHILTGRSGELKGRADEALAALGLERDIIAIVDGFSAAIALARGSDLIATVPSRYTQNLRQGTVTLPLPLTPLTMKISMIWHPRMDGDRAHAWLRDCLREVCHAEDVTIGSGPR